MSLMERGSMKGIILGHSAISPKPPSPTLSAPEPTSLIHSSVDPVSWPPSRKKRISLVRVHLGPDGWRSARLSALPRICRFFSVVRDAERRSPFKDQKSFYLSPQWGPRQTEEEGEDLSLSILCSDWMDVFYFAEGHSNSAKRHSHLREFTAQ